MSSLALLSCAGSEAAHTTDIALPVPPTASLCGSFGRNSTNRASALWKRRRKAEGRADLELAGDRRSERGRGEAEGRDGRKRTRRREAAAAAGEGGGSRRIGGGEEAVGHGRREPFGHHPLPIPNGSREEYGSTPPTIPFIPFIESYIWWVNNHFGPYTLPFFWKVFFKVVIQFSFFLSLLYFVIRPPHFFLLQKDPHLQMHRVRTTTFISEVKLN